MIDIKRLPYWEQKVLNDEKIPQEMKNDLLSTAENDMDIEIPEELIGYEGDDGDEILPEEQRQEAIKNLKIMRDCCKSFLDLTGTNMMTEEEKEAMLEEEHRVSCEQSFKEFEEEFEREVREAYEKCPDKNAIPFDFFRITYIFSNIRSFNCSKNNIDQEKPHD